MPVEICHVEKIGLEVSLIENSNYFLGLHVRIATNRSTSKYGIL